MSAVGGSIESIDLAGRYFSVPADAEVNRQIGGFKNEVMANGDGTARLIKTRVPLMLDGLSVVCDDFAGDHEFLQELADRNDFFAATITYSSGAVWQGSLQITDDLKYSNTNATCTFGLSGVGILTQQ